MKNWLLIINILTLLGLTACQGSKETIVEKHYVNENGTGGYPVPPSQQQGGADPGGGGNGVDGKPLESFRINILQNDSFLRVKTNVINKLTIRFPKLAADLLHVAEEKAWYLIPTEINALPNSKIGASFRNEQLAIQKLKEVWIDDLFFSKMTARDQDTLILHELVMGVRLFEFSSLLDKCLIEIAPKKLNPENMDQYNEARRQCFKKFRNISELGNSIGLGKDIRLEESDYTVVREITNILLTQTDSFNIQELEDVMAARNFRKYAQ